MKNIIIIATTFICTSAFGSINLHTVDCEMYAYDMLDVIETHFGAIEDCATYEFTFSFIHDFCMSASG